LFAKTGLPLMFKHLKQIRTTNDDTTALRLSLVSM
jgi:hypothetical protein